MKKIIRLFVMVFLQALIVTACDNSGSDSDSSHAWTEANGAPFAYNRFDGEYSNATGKVYFLGGRLSDNTTTVGHIWEYDPVTGDYNYLALDLPYPVSNYNIARLTDPSNREVFVVFGGRLSNGTYTNRVQCFYPATLTFADLTSTDPYPVSTGSGGVAVVDNKAYAIGGYDGSAVIVNTYIFDITAASGSRWTTGPNLSVARGFIATAVVDDVIYAIGGDSWIGSTLIAQTIVEKLDTKAATLTWDDAGVADLPITCDETQAFGFDSNSKYHMAGSIVVAGCGRWSMEYVYSLRYNVAKDTWDESFPDLNQARRNHAGVFIPEGEGVGRPGIWVWGGRQGMDTNILRVPEFY